MTTICLVPTNIQGQPVGEHARRTRFSDATVARARVLRIVGWTLHAIAAEVRASRQSISDWDTFRRCKPPARVVARHVKPQALATPDAGTGEETPSQGMSHRAEAFTCSASSPSSTLLDSTLDSNNRKKDQKGHTQWPTH